MRRNVGRLLAAAVVATGLVPVMAGVAWGCTCAASPDDVGARSIEAKRVFSGQITEITQLPGGVLPTLAYTVHVDTVLKGDVAKVLRVSSPTDEGGSCGVRLSKGAVLVLDRGDGVLNLCYGTTQRDVAANLAAARLAMQPPSAEPSARPIATATEAEGWDPPPYAAGIAVFVAAVFVLADSWSAGGKQAGGH